MPIAAVHVQRQDGEVTDSSALLQQAGDGEPPTGRTGFPHLRILHLGTRGRFRGLAPHTDLAGDGWRSMLRDGGDLLLIEPPARTPGWDPFNGELAHLLRVARELGIPSVRIHRSRIDPQAPGCADLELAETSEALANTDTLAPSIDPTRWHPRGWRRLAPDAVALRAAPLGANDEEPPIADRMCRTFDPTPIFIAPSQADGRAMRRTGVLLDVPGLQRDTTARVQRWLEALACGTPVVSIAPPPVGLPPGVVAVDDEAGAIDAAHALLRDPDRRERSSIVGRRHALTEADRASALRRILRYLDVPFNKPPRISVLLVTRRPHLLEHASGNIARQHGSDVDVSLVLHGPAAEIGAITPRGIKVGSVVRAPDRWTLGDCLNAALDAASGELVTKMDDDDHYGPDHLTDLVIAWRHSGADVVGKPVEFIHLAERNITLRRRSVRTECDRHHVGGPTMLAARSTLRRFGFLRLSRREDSTLYERVLASGGRVYGTHTRDIVLSRRGTEHGHAWHVRDEELLRQAVDTRAGLALDWASSAALTG